MERDIRNTPSQFNFTPVVENESGLRPADSFVVCGMGGSHLGAGLLKIYDPSLDIYIHRDYGLPGLSQKRFKDSLYIASSYSGNTEEVVDFAERAFEAKHNLAVVATGGKLIDFAKKNNLPYILITDTGLQPRNAVGLSFISLVRLTRGALALDEIRRLGEKLHPNLLDKSGMDLAQELKGKIPVVYSSRTNLSIAYNWKIKFNESSKIPAFYNVFPELNHNEMTGFDVIESTKELSKNFCFILLTDSEDRSEINHRMIVLKKLLENRGLPVKMIKITGETKFAKIFNTLSLADWTSFYLSRIYGTNPESVPMVEEFKKLIA